MDDTGKAIVMTGQVLLFVTASSVSIFLYSTLTDRAENMLIANTNNNRGDAIVAVENIEKREVSGAEVVMAILDLKEKEGGSIVQVDSVLYGYDSTTNYIEINNIDTFEYNTKNLRTYLINNIAGNTYEMADDLQSNKLVYKFFVLYLIVQRTLL